ncbi:MAG: permease-like cell division protein FtsX [Clostridiales bacterium]|nr:permease-like cell division protein FtsX [Clostridiales bacterium]
MSIRAFFNSVKEGFKSIGRHPLVTIASITTILLMLIIISSFFIFSVYARSVMRRLEQQPPVEVYMELGADEQKLQTVEDYISKDARIMSYEKRSPEQNYNYFKENLGDSSSVLDSLDYNTYLPYTFNIRMNDPAQTEALAGTIRTIPGVSKVDVQSRVMDILARARHIVNITSVAAFVVLFIIALFIISNMVRISVYSRASEIEIMKFVGATNSYIRLPYIVEGAIVGLISAICAWGITILVYYRIYVSAMAKITPVSFYALISVRSIMWWVLLISAVTGILIGSIGSGISVRKYIKV